MGDVNVGADIEPSLPRFASVIEHGARLEHGFSGGPLLNRNGTVAGVNTYVAGGGGDSSSYYAISAERIRRVLPKLDARKSSEEVGWNLVSGTRSKIARLTSAGF